MTQLTLLFVIFLATILTVPLSARLGVPSPVLMTVFGTVMALVPDIPNTKIDPSLILPLVLPPLLFAAARRSHWRQFRSSWPAILLLAVALVLVSTAAVALAYVELVPTLPVAAAVLLGALTSPPDPVAAVAVAGDVGMPRRLVTILETEGLFNDVTAIVIYGVAVTAVVQGHFTTSTALIDLLLSAVIAVVVGLGIGWAAVHVIGFLGDATLQVALTLLIPYAAYMLSAEFHGSGVLAVLLCGLYLSDRTDVDDVAYRLVGTAFWDIVELLVTGFSFGLIGQELYVVVKEVGNTWTQLLGDALWIVAVTVLIRLLWLLPAGWLSHRLAWAAPDAAGAADDTIPLTWKDVIVMWWAGMRGVATVALALGIPLTVDGGGPFPGRAQILFTAFVVVLFTLVVQGLTLPFLVRLLGVSEDAKVRAAAERALWVRVTKAQLQRLDQIAKSEQLPQDVYERLAMRQHARLAGAFPEKQDEAARAAARRRKAEVALFNRIGQEMLAAGRRELYEARSEVGADPELVSGVLRQLDLRSEH